MLTAFLILFYALKTLLLFIVFSFGDIRDMRDLGVCHQIHPALILRKIYCFLFLLSSLALVIFSLNPPSFKNAVSSDFNCLASK